MSRFDPFDASRFTTAALCPFCGEWDCTCEDCPPDLDEYGINSSITLYLEEGEALASIYDIAEAIATEALTYSSYDYGEFNNTVLLGLDIHDLHNLGYLSDDMPGLNSLNAESHDDDEMFGFHENQLRTEYYSALLNTDRLAADDDIPF